MRTGRINSEGYEENSIDDLESMLMVQARIVSVQDFC